ncbi:uncharacterized protein PITG_09489 [Phytophthora infestans T30-4]|uniref:Uncharacterized protein n=1 Tax=Phytophthora infestans (strain T30-4) TaxID=403677 RepID=D0NC46_PHYIT|nr:uncharacterized protein PITG_09489 [Phytophthora infestans T30-4]EEY55560.1 hypothetical protein PITG_09489 [Phytophthora infestans T30-4]|eukprot:XP_002903136.1 hypothetical protein PITG_09489 [Phytophthora infestans T30-4]
MSPIQHPQTMLSGAGSLDPLMLAAPRRRRKETVNERVEHILRGALHDAEEEALQEREGDPETRGRALQRSHQLASLYATSTDNKFLRTRAKRDASLQRTKDERVVSTPGLHCDITRKAKPWYGSSPTATLNQQLPPGITLDAKLRRYGARGTAKLRGWRSQESLEPLSHSVAPIDEFVTGVRGSPSLWPPETFHPSGSRLRVTMTRCPSSPIAVSMTTQKLQKMSKQEKKVAHEEKIQNQRSMTEWRSRTLHFEPSSELSDHREQQKADPQMRHRRTQASAIVQTPGYSPEKQRSKESSELNKKRFKLRWRSFAQLLDAMRRTPCRRPVLQDMEKLFALASELGALNALGTCTLSRSQFTQLITREFPLCELKFVNRLFSSYDWEIRDSVDTRIVLGTLRAMRVQQGESVELICASLRDFDSTSDLNGKNVDDNKALVSDGDSLIKALSLCCSSDEEEKDMRERAEAIWTTTLSWQRQILSRRLHGGVRHNFEDVEDTVEETSELVQLVDESRVPVRRIREALKRERETLALFTEQLLQRRHECLVSATMSTPRT